jgi:hypothetical protein
MEGDHLGYEWGTNLTRKGPGRPFTAPKRAQRALSMGDLGYYTGMTSKELTASVREIDLTPINNNNKFLTGYR